MRQRHRQGWGFINIPTRASHERRGFGSRGRVELVFQEAKRDFRPLDEIFSSVTWSAVWEIENSIIKWSASTFCVRWRLDRQCDLRVWRIAVKLVLELAWQLGWSASSGHDIVYWTRSRSSLLMGFQSSIKTRQAERMKSDWMIWLIVYLHSNNGITSSYIYIHKISWHGLELVWSRARKVRLGVRLDWGWVMMTQKAYDTIYHKRLNQHQAQRQA